MTHRPNGINTKMSVILYLIWMSTYGLVLSQSSTCTTSGWFGSQCQYQCHCKATTCQTDGSCASGDSCSPGWFGPACQYVDLAINRTVETTGDKQNNTNDFTDGNDDSCNIDTTVKSIKLTLSQPYLVSWLRLQTKTAGYLQSVTVSFSRQSQAVKPSKTCVTSLIKGGLIMDIFCDLSERVENVVLTGDGVKTLCSLYVSGGRNVALKQQATQISTYSINNATLAVDGNTDGVFNHNSCAATESASPGNPYWYVNLSYPATVRRCSIWNSVDNYPQRLNGFLLKSFDSRGNLIYNYTAGTNIASQAENKVIPDKPSVSVSDVTIIGNWQDKVLTLCEVQVFGDCDSGWFGLDCKFKCHCRGNTTCWSLDGQCSSCEPGWFGPGCQYSDLMQESVTVTPPVVSTLLSDGNETSCIDDSSANSVTVSWSTYYRFTWLRIHVNNQTVLTDLLNSFEISFTSKTATSIPCGNRRSARVTDNIADIHCDVQEPVQNVTLTGNGVKSLCELHISGGRNVALRQQTSQSDTWSDGTTSYGSDKAVDGDTDGDILNTKTCSATSTGREWKVEMLHPVRMDRCVLYERTDPNGNKLTGFTLTIFNASGSQVYNYKDNSGNRRKYPVIPDKPVHLVSHVEIEGNPKDILSICEAEIYGDTECQAGKYGRECEHECNCADKTESCFASTGGCPSGCADGYMGEDCTQSCDKGWFGSSCRFKCHRSDDKCQPIVNQCSFCKPGWFGPDCQYVDLMQTSIELRTSPVKDISDNNDTTCLTNYNNQTVSITWNTSFHFMWLRITVKDPVVWNSIVLNFNTSSLPCDNPRNASVNDRTLDVHCNLPGPVDKVTLTGPGISSLCSVYISGGRNVALHQATSQTSTYDVYGPAKAVDGQTNGDFWSGRTCTATMETDHPAWNITFLLPVKVVKYVLYNRVDSYDTRLKGFLLTSYKAGDNVNFSYTDPEPNALPIYYVTPPSPSDSVTHIRVNKAFPATKDVITLCEFQVFGETECQARKYGRECEHTCNCASKTESCFVSTGGCPSGCPDGYIDVDCSQPCYQGAYGKDCKLNCSENCIHVDGNGTLVCDHVNGTCEGGCRDGYLTPLCDKKCTDGRYGKDCLFNCSQSCFPPYVCNHVNGTCSGGCVDGYTGPFCNITCQKGKYGKDCLLNCSQNCLTPGNCTNTNGSCTGGCAVGYVAPVCNTSCANGSYGQDCMSNCSQFCVGGNGAPLCNYVNGSCTGGCKEGYTTELCNQSCPNGTYGMNCASDCSDNCIYHDSTGVSFCHHVTGNCNGGCMDGFSAPLCTELIQNPESASPGAIAGAVIGAIAVAAIICAGVFIWWRRRKPNQNKEYEEVDSRHAANTLDKSTNGGTSHAESLELTTNSRPENPPPKNNAKPSRSAGEVKPGEYYNILPQSSPTIIPLKDLDTFLATHNKSFFQEQFSTIPVNNKATTEAAERPENKTKNRFKNIYAYDHSRVHLMGSDDYINASHIKGYKGEEKFIATQGPTESSLNDFIRMLWEQDVEKVIMLTNVIEKTRKKCEQYWPEDADLKAGEITICLAATQVYGDYTIRKLQLKKAGHADHSVTHYHFTSWPDLDVPLTPWGLVDFEQRVTSVPTRRPIVVHCSAGVGRTGTFIALRNIMKQAEDVGNLDVFSTVQKLRHDRINMVQTSTQYHFLHKAAQVAILCMGTTVGGDEIQNKINALERVSDSGLTHMEKEFTTICSLNNNYEVDQNEMDSTEESSTVYENYQLDMNRHKNRLNNIIPKPLYRPVLQCETDYLGEYINAVFVPSFRKQEQFVLTQVPLSTTVIDFWRLVTQHDVSLIVAFQDDSGPHDSTIGEYLPPADKRTIVFSLFEVESQVVSTDSLWKQSKLTITTDIEYKKSKISKSAALKEEHVLTHLKCLSTDLDPKKLLALVTKIRSLIPAGENKTVFMCRNGADYSGLVYVLCLLLDRMDNDSCLTVPLVVGAVKAIRPQVIPTLDQYKMLYQVLKLYSETSSVYANISSPD